MSAPRRRRTVARLRPAANMVPLVLCLFACLSSCFCAEFTLPDSCPDIKIQEKFDTAKFTGIWYTAGSYASDGRAIYDCSSMDFQEDNIGLTLRESYVDGGRDQGNRTQKSYVARVDPTFDAEDKAKFIVSYQDGDKVLQFPFVVLSTDYEQYAVAYTCKTYKGRPRRHYVFAWVLSRTKDSLEGDRQQTVNSVLSRYPELAANRQSFVFKDFSEQSCSFTNKMETDFFTNNFW